MSRVEKALAKIKAKARPEQVSSMARFGMTADRRLGLSVPDMRQIGKRNLKLNQAAIKTAKEIQKKNSKAARWIASDALREFTSESIQKKLK
jgi:3-methyladenine DNA glycosylase AlkD